MSAEIATPNQALPAPTLRRYALNAATAFAARAKILQIVQPIAIQTTQNAPPIRIAPPVVGDAITALGQWQ